MISSLPKAGWLIRSKWPFTHTQWPNLFIYFLTKDRWTKRRPKIIMISIMNQSEWNKLLLHKCNLIGNGLHSSFTFFSGTMFLFTLKLTIFVSFFCLLYLCALFYQWKIINWTHTHRQKTKILLLNVTWTFWSNNFICLVLLGSLCFFLLIWVWCNPI